MSDLIRADQYLFSLYLSLITFLFLAVIACCFHFFYCMLQASEIRSAVTCKMDTFKAVVNHIF